MALVAVDIVDAFAERPCAGNPAAVVPEARGLSETDMMRLADELRMEAGFVLPPSSGEADLRLRFFTPRREAMLSGHVLVAALVALADRGAWPATGSARSLRVETGHGILPVTLETGGGAAARVTFDLPPPRFGEPVAAAEAATALGLPAAAVGLGDNLPQRVSCGFDVLVVPLAERTAALALVEDMGPIRRLADRLGVGGIATFCPEVTAPGVDLLCRFFYPSEGTNEDVVSGTSLGAVACYCTERGIVPRAPRVRIVSEQGHILGRPNRAAVELVLEGRRIARVTLTASGVVVLRGEIRLASEASGVAG